MLGFQGKKNLLIKILLKPVEQLYCCIVLTYNVNIP